MALPVGKYMPKGASEYGVDPVPFAAVAGAPSLTGGDRAATLGAPEPLPVTIHIGDENLLAIIADLTDRIEALEA